MVICLQRGVNELHIAYGPPDAIATESYLAPVKSRMIYLFGAGLPRWFQKKGH